MKKSDAQASARLLAIPIACKAHAPFSHLLSTSSEILGWSHYVGVASLFRSWKLRVKSGGAWDSDQSEHLLADASRVIAHILKLATNVSKRHVVTTSAVLCLLTAARGSAQPYIDSLSSYAGPTAGGNSVLINGSNLSGATAVTFGSLTASFLVKSASQLEATVPANSAGSVSVYVKTPEGVTFMCGRCLGPIGPPQYTYVAPPSIDGVSPQSGPLIGGNQVVITGRNLVDPFRSSVWSVTFGDTPAQFSDNASKITATAPPHVAGTVPVVVTTIGGRSTYAAYKYGSAPSITSLSPAWGPIDGGNTVVIRGSDLENITGVTFGSNAALFTVSSSSEISAVAPPGFAGTVAITVTNPYGSVSSGSTYRYLSPPTIALANPKVGATQGGNRVRLTGNNFVGVTSVTFGGKSALDFTVDSETLITATTPSGVTGPATVQVTTSVGAGLSASLFQYVGARKPNEYAYLATAVGLGVLHTATGAIVATVPISPSPQGIAITPQGTRVLATSGSSLYLIDPATNKVVKTITVGSGASGIAIAPDGSVAYVANRSSNNVSIISLVSSTVIDTIAVGTQPSGIAITPAGARVYVANTGSNSVSVINTSTNKIIATVTTGIGPTRVIANNATAYVTNAGSNSATVIKVSDNTILGTVSVGASPYGVTIDPGLSIIAVANFQGNSVSLINASTTGVIGTVPVRYGAALNVPTFQPVEIAVDSTGTYAWATSLNSGEIAMIDLSSKNLVGTLLLGVYGPIAIAEISTAPPLPVINAISPGVGAVNGGTVVTINGSNLSNVTTVTFNGKPATGVQIIDNVTLLATTPPGSAGTASVIVSTSLVSSGSTRLFTYVGSTLLTSGVAIQGVTPEPSTAGQPYAISVRASGASGTPTGSVRVTDGSAYCDITLTAGSGSCVLISETAGTKSIQASYSGDGLYQPSSSTTTHAVVQPSLQILNGASFSSSVAPNSWISIFGTNLGPPGLRIWQWSDFNGDRLPLGLDGASVSVDGQLIPMNILSQSQINALLPSGIAQGTHNLTVAVPSKTVSQQFQVVSTAPALFISHYADGVVPFGAILDSQYNPTGWPDKLPGAIPVTSGTEVTLWSTGMGIALQEPVDSYRIPAKQIPLRAAPSCDLMWGPSSRQSRPIELSYSALVGIGLYQFNAKIPSGLPSGTYKVSCTVSGVETSPSFIAVSVESNLHVSAAQQELQLPAAGGSASVIVTTQNLPLGDIQITEASSLLADIQVAVDAQNPYRGTITVRANPNGLSTALKGYLVIGPQIVKLSQAGN